MNPGTVHPSPLGWSGSLPYRGKPQRQQDLVVLFYFQILPLQDGAI
jgi:hypothetical protein